MKLAYPESCCIAFFAVMILSFGLCPLSSKLSKEFNKLGFPKMYVTTWLFNTQILIANITALSNVCY